MAESIDILPLLGVGFEEIVGAIVFVLYILGQLLANRGEDKPQPKPRPPRSRPKLDADQPKMPVDGAAPQDQAKSLRSEVEEFLRKVQGEPEPIDTKPRVEPRPQPAKSPQREFWAKPLSEGQERHSSSDSQQSPKLRNEGVAEHVARHLDTSQIAQQVAQLGDEVELADERLESHLKEQFDHQVGSLEHRETADDDSRAPDLAAEIASMLSTPQGMRQMVVAQEILRRPEW